MKNRDNRTYQNFKYWPTEKLKQVLSHEFNQGINGADYRPYIDEINEVYQLRLNKILEDKIEREILEREEKGL